MSARAFGQICEEVLEMENQNRRVIVIGAGAQAKYALDIFSLIGTFMVDGVFTLQGGGDASWVARCGKKFLGSWADAKRSDFASGTAFIACFADPEEKSKAYARAESYGLTPISAIHPKAVIAQTASIGAGSIVNAGAVVQPFACIGRGAMIHANVVVDHDCELREFINLAPGVRLAGWVKLERYVTVFTGANVIPGVSIGEGSIVGAGATVISDIPANSTSVGTPARLLGDGSVES